MKALVATFRQGFNLLSKKGKRAIYVYLLSLCALSLLDAAALVILSNNLLKQNGETPTIGTNFQPLLFVILLFAGRTALSTIASWYAVKQFALEEIRIGQENFEKTISSPWSDQSEAQITKLFNNVDQGPSDLVQGFLMQVVAILAEVFTSIAIFTALLYLQPLTALVASIYFVLVAIVQHKLLSESSARAGNEYVASFNRVYALLAEVHAIRKPLLIMNSSTLNNVLLNERVPLANARARSSFLAMLPRYFMELILAVGIVVIGFVAYIFNGTNGAFSALTLFCAAGFRLLPIVNRIQGLILQLFSNLPRAQHAFYNQTTKAVRPEQLLDHESKNLIELDKVSFRYNTSETNAVTDASLIIEKGKRYAIVGASGSGKTTLVDLILGIHTPMSGEIHRRQNCVLGYVPQDTHLIKKSIAENIALEWDSKTVRLESASEIVKSLNLNSLSSRFDGTHDKVIEQQFSISGGEKQRIGLGRALYRNPTLLVLDEATSSLDGETEQQIMKVLTDLPKETAIISIAHRITTIRNADVILFMKEGKISNTGNFEELIAASWEFSELVRLSTLN